MAYFFLSTNPFVNQPSFYNIHTRNTLKVNKTRREHWTSNMSIVAFNVSNLFSFILSVVTRACSPGSSGDGCTSADVFGMSTEVCTCSSNLCNAADVIINSRLLMVLPLLILARKIWSAWKMYDTYIAKLQPYYIR